MPSYMTLTPQQSAEEIKLLEERYQQYKDQNLKLNMTRGKPCPEQLDLSNGLLTCLKENDYFSEDKTDCRNYGGLEGIIEARRLFADLLDTKTDNVMVVGNSSLNLMHDLIGWAMLFPVPGAEQPWSKLEKVRFICPVPGYDRHFFVTQAFGVEMIPVPMTATGPDMDQVEALVAADASIKGIWSVPVYSNPEGVTYSEATCRRLATMTTAAPDFRIMWDNAYIVHHLDFDQAESTPDILKLCEEAGHPDRVYEFGSTSKITFAGSGVACLATSPANLSYIRKRMSIQTIGPDKINQLRHIRFLQNKANILAIMKRHAAILKPKFDLVERILTRELEETGVCQWKKPNGGYFVSLSVLPGTAAEVVQMTKACGVELTPAGNPYPCGLDPQDTNIRLAPSYPPLPELETALEVICTCIRLAALRHTRR